MAHRTAQLELVAQHVADLTMENVGSLSLLQCIVARQHLMKHCRKDWNVDSTGVAPFRPVTAVGVTVSVVGVRVMLSVSLVSL
eukprot:SAG11_NODE_231_length_11932_cov_40.992817_3_plen_83_part_00